MSKLPSLRPSLLDYLEGQKRNAKRQANSSAFARSGTSVTAEGVIEVDGTLSVVGDLDVSGTATVGGTLGVTGPTTLGGATTVSGNTSVSGSLGVTGPMTVGGTLGVTGDATFSGDTTIGGNAAITGTLSLPAGIIGNDSLTSPVMAQEVFFWAQGFAVPVAGGTFASQTVTVPAGFTSAVVSVVSRLYALNSTGALSSISCVSKIDAAGGFNLQSPAVAAGDAGTSVSPYTAILTGRTPGSTFLLQVNGNVNVANWAAWVGNTAEMSGSILWFR